MSETGSEPPELPGLELHNELVIVECREAPVETREHLA